MSVTLDMMEYANNGATQAAYMTDASGSYDSYTKLLCHFDGTTGDKPTPAATGQTITYAGTAQVSSVWKKFGTASLLLDGNSDYVTVPDSDDWNFGTGNFTIDFWVNFNSLAAGQAYFSQFPAADNSWWFRWTTTNRLYVGINDGGVSKLIFYCSWTPSTGVDYHIAVIRKGTDNANTDWAIAINGVLKTGADLTKVGGAWNDAVPDYAAPFTIGYDQDSGYYLNGYIDEFRISKGIARWTADFTPPTAEYPATYALQSYSEATIKTQGSYSLKGVAAITDSNGKTLTRTVSPPIDLTDQTKVKFDIRSSRTGANIKLGLGGAAGANTWTAGQSGTFTVPPGVTQIIVTLWGGGGDGAGGAETASGGGGGAGCIVSYPLTVTPSQNISYSVGAGGIGTDGADTYFGVLYGKGGKRGYTVGDGGVGGDATDGTHTSSGGAAGTGGGAGGNSTPYGTTLYGGGGGGGGNGGASGGAGGTGLAAGGAGGSGYDGGGGGGSHGVGGKCSVGLPVGGGGGGGANGGSKFSGQDGADGYLSISYTAPIIVETTPTIIAADTFQTVSIDISAISNYNKSAINKIIFTIVEATAANTFYIDNMFGEVALAYSIPLASITYTSLVPTLRYGNTYEIPLAAIAYSALVPAYKKDKIYQIPIAAIAYAAHVPRGALVVKYQIPVSDIAYGAYVPGLHYAKRMSIPLANIVYWTNLSPSLSGMKPIRTRLNLNVEDTHASLKFQNAIASEGFELKGLRLLWNVLSEKTPNMIPLNVTSSHIGIKFEGADQLNFVDYLIDIKDQW